MNAEKNKRARRCAAVVTLLAVLAAAGLWGIYRATRYLPVFTAAAITALPALINLLFFLPHGEPSPKEENEAEPAASGKKGLSRVFPAVGRGISRAASALVRFCRGHNAAVVSVAALLVFAGFQFREAVMLRRMTSLYRLSYLHVVLFLALFVVFVILEKTAKHAEADCAGEEGGEPDRRTLALLRNVRSALAAGRLSLICIFPCTVIRLLGFAELQKLLSAVLAVIFYYVSLLLLLTFLTRLIRRELVTSPDLRIPVPFSGGADLGFIAYLEENTGITMRSLWSLKLLRGLLPYAVLLIVLLLWGATGIVQIDAGQHGALYRLGRLADEPLEPGLHLVLPYPFDRVTVYDTESVRKKTVGYLSEENNDNLWTASHGSEEFRLLLGGGNEVVSINLRIEYRIKDLIAYLRGSAQPESLLEAYAYELITQRTIGTDLDTLLAADREKFAGEFAAELSEKTEASGTGLEIVSVVLESIHPPIEIAGVYQSLIGAEVLADKYILQAEGNAAAAVARAEAERDTALGEARAEQAARVAAAGSDVAQFKASVEAHNADPDSYEYYKYLRAISGAYGSANLILVGEGVRSSRIYFGSVGALEIAAQ